MLCRSCFTRFSENDIEKSYEMCSKCINEGKTVRKNYGKRNDNDSNNNKKTS